MKDDEADENRTPDLRIAKPTFTLIVTFNQSHTHSDFHAFGLKRTLEDRKGQQSAPLWLHPGDLCILCLTNLFTPHMF